MNEGPTRGEGRCEYDQNAIYETQGMGKNDFENPSPFSKYLLHVEYVVCPHTEAKSI